MEFADTGDTARQPLSRRLVALLSTAVVVGSMNVTFVLSLAAIVYSGPLAPFVGKGIALTLIGAIVMAIVGALTLTYRGSLVQPQDVTAILVSLCAASIAGMPGLGAESAFSTVVVLIGLTSIATGIAAYAMGAFRLGYLVRFVPFPVVSGFLAASGVLLVRGAFDMVAPQAMVGDGGLLAFLADRWPAWLPWLALAGAIVAASRFISSASVIPVAIMLALAAFYPILWMLGLDVESARQLGLLLGPFQEKSFTSGLSLDLLGGVDWYALASQVPVMITIVGIALLGTLLNASGLELAIESDIDFEKDLKGVGVANVAAGLAGGMVGYHILGETLLSRRFGLVGRSAGFAIAAVPVIVLFFGAEILSYLPIGLFAAVIWYLGIDLMLTAFWDHGSRMPGLDLAIVLATPAVAMVFGFMPAVMFGVAVAVGLFVIAYSGIDADRLSTTGANFHARVERSPEDYARLAEIGGAVRISKLSGFLFFGSASRLVDRLQRQFDVAPRPRMAIVDLKGVVGMDMSAWAAFERLGRGCRQRGTELVVTGLSAALKARFLNRRSEERTHFRLADDLDDVLVEIEDKLLADDFAATGKGRPDAEAPFGMEDGFAGILRKYGYWMTLAAGDTILAEGARSDHLIFLLSGRCRATILNRKGAGRMVSRFLPGAILGEIAYYAGVPRTATVTAETPATAVRIDADALARMERDDPAAAASFHRTLAVILARRLMATTRLLNDAEL